MKLVKIMSVILSVCLLCGALVACGTGDSSDTTAAAAEKITVEVKIRDGKDVKYEDSIEVNDGTNAYDTIELLCAGLDIAFEGDEETNTITKIGDIAVKDKANYWVGYYEDEGTSSEFSKFGDELVKKDKVLIVYIK